MILSHAHRFVFIKTKKTAGTSIEIELSKHCGPDDIITPLAPDDEIRRLESGGRPAQNFSRDAGLVRGFQAAVRARDKAGIAAALAHLSPDDYRNHMGLATVERLAGPLPGYYRFTVERDPCDRILSYIYWKKKPLRPLSAPKRLYYVWKHATSPRFQNYHRYAIDGQVAVDGVIRYDNLDRDYSAVCRKIGIPAPARLIETKHTHRTDRARTLTRLAAAFVRWACAREVAVLENAPRLSSGPNATAV